MPGPAGGLTSGVFSGFSPTRGPPQPGWVDGMTTARTRLHRAPWSLVGLFVLVAFGLAWLVCLPLWLGDGLASPLTPVIVGATMFTPAVAALVVRRVQRRRGDPVTSLGLALHRPVGRVVGYTALGLVGAIALTLGAMLLSGGVGTLALDPARLADGGLLARTVVSVVGMSLLLSLATLGEEIGWRGWLQPALSPLGFWPAVLGTGALWGAWHAPVILLGYNYGRTDATGVLLMIGFSVLAAIGLGALRARSGSLWPSVLAHAALNVSAGTWTVALVRDGATVDPVTSTLLGWPGWLLMAAAIPVLVLLRAVPAAVGAPDRGRRVVSPR